MSQANLVGETCFRTLHLDNPHTLESYKSVGGYSVWQKILKETSISQKLSKISLF